MGSRKLTRRRFLQWSAIAAGSSIIAGCAPKATPSPAEKPTQALQQATKPPATPVPVQKQVTVRYWHNWGNAGVIIDGWQKSQVFKEMTDGFQVEMLEDVAFDKMTTAAASGDVPDVLGFFDYTNWFLRGLCTPLTEYIRNSKVIKLDDYLPNMVEPATVKGEVLGVAYFECGNRYGLNVNTRMTGKVGLDSSKLPETWDDVYEWHKQVTKFDDAKNLLQIGIDPYGEMAGQYQAMVAWWPAVSCGVLYFDNETHKYNFEDPKLIDYVDMCTRFYDLIGPDNVNAFRNTFGEWFVGLVNEGVAMTVNGYWNCGTVYTAKPEVGDAFKPTWPPVPAYRKGTKIAHPSPHFASIPKGAKHPNEGFKVIEYVYCDDACDVVFDAVGYIPGRKSYLNKVPHGQYPGLAWYLETGKEATDFSVVPQDPLSSFNKQQWVALREKAFRHQITAKEAMKELQRVATEEYKRQFGS